MKITIDLDRLQQLIKDSANATLNGAWESETECIGVIEEMQIHLTFTKDESDFIDKVNEDLPVKGVVEVYKINHPSTDTSLYLDVSPGGELSARAEAMDYFPEDYSSITVELIDMEISEYQSMPEFEG